MTNILRRVGGRQGAARFKPRDTIRALHRYRAPDGFEAFIPESVVARIFAFAREAVPSEWAGLLAVCRYEDVNGSFVSVEAVLPFDGARADHVNVATTVEAELRARELLVKLYPDAEPGGWCHSHPNLSPFFSETDKITQRTWQAPTSLGVVVDPALPDQMYVVHGPHSEVMQLVDERPAPQSLVQTIAPQARGDQDRPDKSAPATSTLPPSLLGCMLILLVITGVGLRSAAARISRLERRVGELAAAPEVESLRAQVQAHVAAHANYGSAASEELVCAEMIENTCTR